MKKITAIVLAALVLVVCFAVVASAAANPSAQIIKDTVLKGTAKVDGDLDQAYLSSLQVKLNPPKYAGSETNVKATCYALYDDAYVYVFYKVENDTTLMSADDDYIQDHYHPSLNDAVELRIGDDLEEKLPPYDGSNAAHHLFLMDAYGKRFSCYEDALFEYLDLMQGAAKIVSGTAYNVEMAIPLAEGGKFNDGDIIQFNFQIDDLQDDVGTTGYIGLGETYMTLVDFTISGQVADGATVVDPEKPEEPAVKPEEPAVKPEEPAVKPEEPAVKPEEPAVKPEEPAVKPEEPAVKPEEPVVDPDEPVVDPDAPVEDPDAPVVEPDEPAVEPDEPAVEPDEPAVEEPKEEGSNVGLIIGIVAAVVVIAAIVVVVLKKKK